MTSADKRAHSGSPRAAKKVKVSSCDEQIINCIRCIGAELPQLANSGHPGAPMGCAPMAHALYGYLMKYSADNPNWWNRDRFVLSNGHACALLYTMLHLAGYDDVTSEDLANFRQLHSKTAGHPENFLLNGVEVTTGPLGQGIANAVGLALGQSHLSAVYNKPGFELFNNFTFVICGDGCLMEGVSYEACSLAGHLQLGRLIVLYDDNEITIDGSTSLAFTEDVTKRFEAQNWQVISVADGDHDLEGIKAAVEKGKANLSQPTLIRVRTTIGFASARAGTAKAHGAPLGNDDIRALKSKFGMNPDKSLEIPAEVKEFYRARKAAMLGEYQTWTGLFQEYKKKHADAASELERRFSGALPDGWKEMLPKYTMDSKPAATRALSGECLAALVKHLPEVIGGSADLTGSNLNNQAGLSPMTAADRSSKLIAFGVREHAMSAITNGLCAYGGFLPYCATFLNFVGYSWGATRLAALSGFKQLFIGTHDSIDLGEDGPTHQPVEILPLLRATPNMTVYRPADGEETAGAYIAALEAAGPCVMALSRGAVPHLAGSNRASVARGGYVLEGFSGKGGRKVVLAGSGTEVSVCVEAAKQLREKNCDVSVVSVPSLDLYLNQPAAYRASVLPKDATKVFVEASSSFGLSEVADLVIGMETFGKSGPAKKVKEYFGFTADRVAQRVLDFRGE